MATGLFTLLRPNLIGSGMDTSFIRSYMYMLNGSFVITSRKSSVMESTVQLHNDDYEHAVHRGYKVSA